MKGGVVGVFILAVSALRVDAAAPESELWERWAAHSPSAVATIDHGEWDAFLAKNLVSSPDDISRIAYAGVSEAEKKRLDDYLSDLSAVAISRSALDRLALRDRNFGWTVEMQIQAARHGLRVREVRTSYRRRIGRSKISGTLRGAVGAGVKILFVIFRNAVQRG